MARDGWAKADVRRFVWKHTHARVEGSDVPKFRQPDNIKIIVAGWTAGRFSAWIPGWPFRDAPSSLVFRKIRGF